MGSYSPIQIQNIISAGLATDTASATAYLDSHGGGGSSAADPGALPVFWGGMELPDSKKAYQSFVQKDPDLGGRRVVPAHAGESMSVNDGVAWLEEQFYKQSPAWQQLVQIAVSTGRYGTTPSPGDVENLWKEALGWSASLLNANPDNKLSPMDYLSRLVGPGVGKAKTVTQHQSQTNVSSALDAKGLANSQAQNDLGRDLTPSEQAVARARLNEAERANPSLTTQTTHYDANGVVSSQAGVTTGGLGAAGTGQALHDQLAQNPDYGAYQAAGFYAPLLFQALAATTGAGS